MQLSPASVVGVSRDQVASSVGGETVILGMTRSRYYGIDPLGSRVWALLQSPTPVSTVVRAITEEYEVSPERCEADLLAFIQRLVDEGLAEVHPSDAR